jgi:hypothetical protein
VVSNTTAPAEGYINSTQTQTDTDVLSIVLEHGTWHRHNRRKEKRKKVKKKKRKSSSCVTAAVTWVIIYSPFSISFSLYFSLPSRNFDGHL